MLIRQSPSFQDVGAEVDLQLRFDDGGRAVNDLHDVLHGQPAVTKGSEGASTRNESDVAVMSEEACRIDTEPERMSRIWARSGGYITP